KGYKCVFTMPDKMSYEKVKLLRSFGAEVVITPTAVPPDHPDNYVMKAKQIVRKTPNSILANQFYNPVNALSHYESTGPEIWDQTDGKVTHFVAAAGTGGTVSGVGKFLKEQNPRIRIVAGDPVGSIYAAHSRSETEEGHPYKVEGIGGDKIPSQLHFEWVDEFVTISDAESFQMARRITREEGLFVGGSSGLNVCVALQLAKRIDDAEALIVVMLPSTGERYLSKFYDDDWMRENQLIEEEKTHARALIAVKNGDAPKLVTVAPTHTVKQAINLMSTYDVSQLPVLRDADCIGSVSEGALMAAALADTAILEQPVQEHMDAPYPVVDGGFDAEQLSALLSHEAPAVLVRDGGQLTGLLTRFDVLRHLAGLK
ncbi:MAG: pyridoxal-phosphate dependent enzyme, partial [Gemmatimonadales bacterium]